ncbi:MAG: hypothetical protein R3Y11_06000 [Pseudomonadota bacterium]
MADIVLQSRLKNCLQTILELEPVLEQLAVRHEMDAELAKLKTFMQRVEHMDLTTESVSHIEEATMAFLEGMRLPIMSLNAKLSHMDFLSKAAPVKCSRKPSGARLLQ